MSNNKFKFYVPVSTFEKSSKAGEEEVYRVGGIISDKSRDSEDESLDYDGFDFSDFSYINWNHGKDPKHIIGEPEKWNIVPGKGVNMEGVIWGNTPLGKQTIDLMKALKNSKRGNRLGWSVEGKVIERDLMDETKVKKAKITAVAICPFPVNGNTFAELLSKGFSSDSFQEEVDLKFEGSNANGGNEFIIDVINDEDEHITVDTCGNISIEKMQSCDNSQSIIKEDVEKAIKKAITIVAEAHKQGLCKGKDIKKALILKNISKKVESCK